jgi:hypothetical protein
LRNPVKDFFFDDPPWRGIRRENMSKEQKWSGVVHLCVSVLGHPSSETTASMKAWILSQGNQDRNCFIRAILYTHDPNMMTERIAINATSRPIINPKITDQRFFGKTISIVATNAITTVEMKSKTPNGWLNSASIGRRWAINEKVVVIPHMGHGKPQADIMMHGSRPN